MFPASSQGRYDSNPTVPLLYVLVIIDRFRLLGVRGPVHHSTIRKEKTNKMQQCIKILLYLIYMKLNMFRATHRPSSGA
jgi:hypothetical protein